MPLRSYTLSDTDPAEQGDKCDDYCFGRNSNTNHGDEGDVVCSRLNHLDLAGCDVTSVLQGLPSYVDSFGSQGVQRSVHQGKPHTWTLEWLFVCAGHFRDTLCDRR